MEFEVKTSDGEVYPLVRDPAHVHPDRLHHWLGTHTVPESERSLASGLSPQEFAIRRMIGVCDTSTWYDTTGGYVGRDTFGIGVVGED